MSGKQSKSSYSIRTAVAFALGSVAMLASAPRAALAADADAGPNPTAATSPAPILEEVTVTGSRIKRKDLESSSPLISVDSEQIEQRAGLNLESYLNNLPNYNPAETPTTENEDVQPSAVNTVGISTISLRGLGPNRSLVLIDGHRTTPVNALMVTDINGIPAAMIDRVEIITGGASTVYGADAISGVTNFILKKDIQGLIVDAQDSMTQAGDGNQLDASVIMGTKIADGKGNITAGMEFYDRKSASQKDRSFFSNAWQDPNATVSNAFFVQGYSGYAAGFAGGPSDAGLGAVFPARYAAAQSGTWPGNTNGVCGFGGCNPFNGLYFNANGTLFTNSGPIASGSNYAGPTSSGGYGLVNAINPLVQNSANTPAPNIIQNLKWNNPLATISEPQTRYAFFANGTYDITDKVQFYSSARFSESLTTTLLDTPTTGTYGWEAEVPFNATTDSPINPALGINGATSQAALAQIAGYFSAGTQGTATVGGVPVANPGFIPYNSTSAKPGHPVPWQLAMLLLSRGAAAGPGANNLGIPGTAFLGAGFGGPAACNNSIAASLCSAAPTSWILNYLPLYSATQRSTVDRSDMFQIETGLRFPVFADWTGDVYYSRGQSLNYEVGYGNDSLQRFRSVIASPNYGAGQYGVGQSFQGNQNGADASFGTSVPSTCTSGFYNTLFSGDQNTSADCMQAVAAPLQTFTGVQQDIVEANFQGTLFKLPAGDVSAAVGYQYRRDSAQFQPDNLQATWSFLDQSIGLYPLGTVNNELSTRDGYAELYIPVVQDLPGLQKLNLDVGGRYSSFSTNIPSATTFKINADAQITKQFRLRGGYNRATRSPNLGELYLGIQEYFGFGAAFGDPCSVRSVAPFGAAGAAPDFSASGSPAGVATKLAGGQTAAGALSTYLICQAQMGGTAPTASGAGTGAAGYYYSAAGGGFSSQGALGGTGVAGFGWLNEQGNPNLRSETATTWTGGIVFSNLSDNPWLSGLSGSVDWWQIDIDHAIELDSPDFANFQCYGAVTVTNAAQAAAQANSAACKNIPRNPSTGGQLTSLLEYTNSATIGIAGVDFAMNWFAQLADIGIKVPGGISFSTQDTLLDYYKTKQSPANFDVDVNWRGSLGPNLAGTNPGAYSYRLNASIGYVLPSFTVNLFWRFLPSVNSAAKAQQQSIIANDEKVAAGGAGAPLSWIPNRDIAAPHWYAFDLSGSWTVNKWLTVRGGIQNLLNREPPITMQTAGNPPGTNLNAVCDNQPTGCTNPTTYSVPNDGAGNTNAGFYDVYGRTFFLGLKARF